jgi:septal ring factor EnvC (AmiA/AmiB activator)
MDALHAAWPKPSGHAVSLRKQLLAGAIVVALVVGALGYVAYVNYASAQQWQERAELARIDVQRLTQERDQLEADVSTVKSALKSSEKDVAQLERRMSQIADEKAQVEDEREHTAAYAERLGEVAVAYDQVATQFQICRAENDRFYSMMLDFEYYYDTDQLYLVDDQAQIAGAECGAAEGHLNELRNYVDALQA